MTAKEAINYINDFGWSKWKLGLDRTRDLLRGLGNPQDGLKFVHVAGTNGKGSTCAMLECVLRKAGYKTGFYPSPYIVDFRERIQVCGEMISEEDLARVTEKVAKVADAMEDHPSQFEIITAIGMVYFAEKKCDIVVLEVGMGGTFDSTNVIPAPEVAVICNIGLDHTEYLGDTIEKIAETKCGIIKRGSYVASYDNVPSVMEVIEEQCARNDCKLYRATDEKLAYNLSLFGEHQRKNAHTVLAIIHALRDRGWEISEEAVKYGLENTVWPARFEVLRKSPPFILDGGHNPQCATALARALDEFMTGQKACFIMGMLADKDYQDVIDIVMPYASEFITLTPNSPRALDAEDLAKSLEKRGISAIPVENCEKAIKMAMGKGVPVVAFGSLYMAGDIKKAFLRTETEQ